MYASTIAHLTMGVAWVVAGVADYTHLSHWIVGVSAFMAGASLIFLAFIEEWGW